MHKVEPISVDPIPDFGTELGSSRGSVVQQEFTDTSTWDEIIRTLEEEALRKFATAER